MKDFISDFQKEKNVETPSHAAPLVCKPRVVEPWRMFKIMSEFVAGFELLTKYGLAVTFFGSARCGLGDAIYKDAERLAGKLSKRGFAIITGGASGIMQAANKGALEAGGKSVGIMVSIPNETRNDYLTDSIVVDHFFVRKVMLSFASEVYVYFPGGFGTLDEFFEILCLVQTEKIKKVPIILYDKKYWEPLLKTIDDNLLKIHGTVSPEDTKLYHVVDSVEEAFEYVINNVQC